MAVRSLRVLPVVVLLAATLLAGCLGGDETLPETDPPAAPPADTSGPFRLATDSGVFVLDSGVEEGARDLPEVRRLGQLDHWETENGAMRLLTDGKAFVLVVDHSVAPFAAGTFVHVRILGSEMNDTVATGMWQVPAGEVASRVPVAVVPVDILRIGKAYAYEVLVFAPDEAPDCLCQVVADEVDGLQVGRIEHAVQGPVGAPDRAPTNQWNGTLLDHHRAALSFRPEWDVTFTGPTEGTDRPDLIEDHVPDGPATGTYTVTFTGKRVWLADLLFDFGASRVHDTRPFTGGNGSTSLQVQLEGWQHLLSYLDLPPAKGVSQTFTLAVDIDHETSDDLPGEEGQIFFVKADTGYRFGGSTYVAGATGKDILVTVQGGP